ncbi:group III truncated hemoglobin [Ohtaekwangia koreensis]|uniref:Hemoglobin n=1 Tax=Ohtaekwangia koreensis TaxID=688867 RepID=A0A1T5MMY6_9BACT|nr:group III truncated hemoglobin [Ohtaekwangia koreensis]SKC89374.1 hemoglobin [Ohtaekwangia koreensis]
MKTLESREDIEVLVNKFYEKVKMDDLLAPLFSHVDWPHHLPILYNFWASILLGDQSYKRNPFEKHIHLPVTPEHFDRWLSHFTKTVDENFEGEKALEAKQRAFSIAGIFQHKLGLLE